MERAVLGTIKVLQEYQVINLRKKQEIKLENSKWRGATSKVRIFERYSRNWAWTKGKVWSTLVNHRYFGQEDQLHRRVDRTF